MTMMSSHVGVLAAVCILMLGVNWIYDMPAALSEPLRSHLSLTKPQYTYLVSATYTAYSAPNTILPIFSGALVCKFGEKWLLYATVACIVVGQLIFTLGVDFRYVWAIVLGRTIFGFGGETLGVLGNSIVMRWYADKKLSFALAILLSMSRLGSVLNSVVTPELVDRYGVTPASWFVTIAITGLTVFSSLYLAPILLVTRTGSAQGSMVGGIKRLPRAYWQLVVICFLGYSVINVFGNSAQRFLAAVFYNHSEVAAGRILSINYIVSSVLVPPFGLLLETPWLGVPVALSIANLLMGLIHFAFYLQIRSVVMLLILLGTGHALFGVALWAGLAYSIRDVDILGPVPLGESRTLLDPEEGDGPHFEAQVDIEDAAMDNSTMLSVYESRIISGEGSGDVAATGLGIASCFVNISTTIVPVVIALVENAFGFPGLELVFVLFAGLGCMASIALGRMKLSDSS